MTDENGKPDQAMTAEPPPAPARKPAAWPMFFAILFAFAALALGAFNFQAVRVMRTDTAVNDSVSRQAEETKKLNERLDALGGVYRDFEARLNELSAAAARNDEAIQRLAGEQGRDNTGWAVAEAEHLIIMAIHSLTLRRDVATALAALQAADDRLSSLAGGSLVDTRRQLAADMNALRAVNVVDIAGLSLYLSDLIGRVEELPLAEVPLMEDTPADTAAINNEAAPAWQRLLTAVWHEIRGMFIVTRTGSNARAALLPSESYFLYQNLRLQLETARLAVLRADTETLRAVMDTIHDWLTDYFNTGDSAVSNVLQTIAKMQQLELDPALPDISSSLETLHAYIKDNSAAGLAAPEAQGQ
jgi:uroporphyrin-3 C-methyltransferase